MTAISGLLSQKPNSSEPVIGALRRFSVEAKPKKNKEGTWNKLKNEGEGYGEEYKILKADRLEDYTGEHGTLHQYSLLIEATSSQEGAAGAGGGEGTVAPAASDNRDESMAQAGAFNAAVAIVAAQINSGKIDHPDISGEVERYARLLLPLRRSGVSAEGNGQPPLDTAESVQADARKDDDIPF